MPRLIPVLVALVSCAIVHAPALAQSRSVPGSVPLKLASSSAGRVQGVVRDDRGRPVSGVAVLALGDTLATTRSGLRGEFSMALPAGEYVLRATRPGYISTYREPIRVRSSVRLERNITIVPVGEAEAAEPMLASAAIAAIQPGADGDGLEAMSAHPHNATAWWLRRLARSILRDSGEGRGVEAVIEAESFADRASFLERAIFGSARAAASFVADVDFTGQLNFLTTGLRDASAGWRPDDWARGVAFMSVGAAAGTHADWQVRGAITPGDLSAWVLDGQYVSRPDRPHALRVGLSFGVQGDLTPRGRRRPTGTETRSVGAVHVQDRWQAARWLDLDYGMRFDRYDYVENGGFVSPSVGARIAVAPGTIATVAASQRTLAPGASEFLPPTASGTWLPPERTFSTMAAGAPFRAERVRHYTVGLEHAIGDGRSVFVRRFRQSTTDQIATLFGVGRGPEVGHYYVASVGDAHLDGWQVGMTGAFTNQVQGTVEYAASRADWTGGPDTRVVGWFVPAAVRRGSERLHDLTLSLDAHLAESDTDLRVGYRLSTGFARARHESRSPLTGARFDIEVRQALPYQPVRGGRLEAMVALRNLFSDPLTATSTYDELLTVAPPLRLVLGLQVRF